MTFATRLKAAREELDKSYEWLADKGGVTAMTLRNYESGKRTPDIDVAAKFAEALGVSLDWLAGLSQKKNPK